MGDVLGARDDRLGWDAAHIDQDNAGWYDKRGCSEAADEQTLGVLQERQIALTVASLELQTKIAGGDEGLVVEGTQFAEAKCLRQPDMLRVASVLTEERLWRDALADLAAQEVDVWRELLCVCLCTCTQ